jgi:hypothetical protein
MQAAQPTQIARKLRFSFNYPLGDHVVFGGALRELHRSHPERFEIEVESPIPDFWKHTPYVTAKPLNRLAIEPTTTSPASHQRDTVETVEHVVVDGEFFQDPNNRPHHMLQSMVETLSRKLGTRIDVKEFRGESSLSPEEMNSPGPVETLIGEHLPYWIICNGGKFDRTVKWWPTSSYQEVVSKLRNRILFVQVGRSRDYHPRLHGTLDLRGWTDIRTLMRLVYHAEGVVCPITSLMHLCAAVPRPPGSSGPRPCVIIGGGIEPPHWTAYPGQRFLSVVGSIHCAKEPCWKARTLTLGDGSTRDGAGALCTNVSNRFPACMRMIGSYQVVRTIKDYVSGGAATTLTPAQVKLASESFRIIGGQALDDNSVNRNTARLAIENQTQRALRQKPLAGDGRGIVTIASGGDFLASAWVMLKLQRHLGCNLPAEIWLLRDRHWMPSLRRHFATLNATIRFYSRHNRLPPGKGPIFAAKPAVINASRFREVLWLDADSFPVCDPSHLFDLPEYSECGAVLWPDLPGFESTKPEAWAMFGLPADRKSPECQGGELLFDKARVSPALRLAHWCNQHRRTFYQVFMGDKDIFRIAFKKTGTAFAMTESESVLRDGCLFQSDFKGRPLFQHRVSTKLKIGEPLQPVEGFLHHDICSRFLLDFEQSIAPELQPEPEPEKDTSNAESSLLKIQ